MKTARVNSGLYRLTIRGKTFEIEKESGGGSVWNLFELVNGRREWWNDFATKKDALNHIAENTDTEKPY
jgi:hypothetical protein